MCLVVGISFYGLLKAWRVSWFFITKHKFASLFLGLIWFFIFTVVNIEVEITSGWLLFVTGERTGYLCVCYSCGGCSLQRRASEKPYNHGSKPGTTYREKEMNSESFRDATF